jgi:hypothetical protein
MGDPDGLPTKKEDPDLQHFLPAELRTRWCVFPRYAVYQLFFVGVLLGAAVTLTIAGLIIGNKPLTVVAPIVLAVVYAQNRFFRRTHKRYESEVMKFASKDSGDRPA